MGRAMAIVNGEVVVDYAYPCLRAEKALRKLHESVLANDYEAAIEAGLEALAEAKLTVNALRDMQERSRR